MDYQFIVTLMAIFAAGAYLLWRGIAGWKKAFLQGCSGGCGCPPRTAITTPRLLAGEDLTLRLRKRTR
jgi:hypothetical protein